MRRGAVGLLGVIGALATSSCASPKRTIRIPDSVVPNPSRAHEPTRPALQPYVIKMSDGRRTYQVEIPIAQATGAFSASIPLDFGELEPEGVDRPPTEADREIVEAKKKAGEPTPKDESARSKSYLATLARVQELFKRRQLELALIELTALDREFPDDRRVLEMKGSLYWKLGRPAQAREAWQRVLALDPNNTVVAQALEQLDAERE